MQFSSAFRAALVALFALAGAGVSSAAHADAGTFGHPALVHHLLPLGQFSDEAMVGSVAHAVVVEAIDRDGSLRTGAARVGQQRIEELVVFQRPIGKFGNRVFATKAVRRIEVRTLRRKRRVEEAADGN